MILEFMTARNKTNGHRRWFALDTEKKVFTTLCPRMIPDGIEVTAAALREIKNRCLSECYKEVDRL